MYNKFSLWTVVLFSGVFALAGFVLPTPAADAATNLITNPTFETIGANGDPVGWFRGGYGQNTRSYQVVSCPYYTSTDTPDTNGNSFRLQCPPDTRNRLEVRIGDYIDGDAKWYFADVAIGSDKNFEVSYDYQPYTYGAKAIARYTFPDGSHAYTLLGQMPQRTGGGMGYVGWSKNTHTFTAPKNAVSLTIFFAVQGNGVCGGSPCSGDMGALSIANVSLTHPDIVSPAPTATNLIKNPSLEISGVNGDPVNWFRGGWGTNTRTFFYLTAGSDGTKATQVVISSYTNGDAKWYFQDVPVTGGHTYKFSNKYRSNIPSQLVARFQTPNGMQYRFLKNLPSASDWTPSTADITVPANATHITVFHLIYSVGYLDIDAFTLADTN